MKKILLVDDEKMVIDAIRNTVDWNKLGCEVCDVCYNGPSALERIKARKPDIIMTDIKMPVMSGLQLIKEVQCIDPYPVFIILSGYGEFELAKEAMKDGVREYLLKPCSETEIENAVRNALLQLSEKGPRQEDDVSREEDAVDVILNYIWEHYDREDLNLKWCASELVYMNEDHISKRFQQKTGCKFTAFLTSVRMEEAKKLLSANTLTIEKVAEAVGYGKNHKYFSKVFKKETGLTPTEYREKK